MNECANHLIINNYPLFVVVNILGDLDVTGLVAGLLNTLTGLLSSLFSFITDQLSGRQSEIDVDFD